MKNKDINSILDSVVNDLNLRYSDEQLLDEGLLDYLKRAGRFAANTGRTAGIGAANVANTVKDAAINTSNSMGDRLGTDASIIRNNLLLSGPDGKLVGIRGIVPNSPEFNDILRMYAANGYKQATPEQQAQAKGQNIKMINPNQLSGNLKPAIVDFTKKLVSAAQAMASEVNSKEVVTASSALKSLQTVDTLFREFNKIISDNQAKAAPAAQEPAATQEPTTPVAQEPNTQTPQEEPPLPVAPEPLPANAPNESSSAPAPTSLPRQPLDFNSQPMAPDSEGLSAGVAKLQSPEVKQRIAAAANQDEEEDNTPHLRTESKEYIGPLEIF